MNLLVTGAWQGCEAHFPHIRAMGHEPVFMPQEAGALPCPPGWVEGIIGNGLFLHHPVEGFPNLRYIQLTSAGTDRVDTGYIRAHGIALHTAEGTYAIPMAEFTLGGVLQLYKSARSFGENQRKAQWNKNRQIRELNGKRVLIIGCGHYGQACAKLFHAFGCRVAGVTRTPRELPGCFHSSATAEQLGTLLPEADIVVLALPGTQENARFIGAEQLVQMKAGAILTNMARGKLVDTAALASALAEGKLLGAVLDVFEEEPLPAHSPLWELPNAILTPHNSFVGDGNRRRLDTIILNKLQAL